MSMTAEPPVKLWVETEDTEEGVTDLSEEPLSGIDTDLLDALVDRALQSEDALKNVEAVASLMEHRIRRGEGLEIPRPIDLLNEDESELQTSCNLRRSLALALLTKMTQVDEFDHHHSWQLVSGWRPARPTALTESRFVGFRRSGRRGIVDSSDFEWLIKKSDEYKTGGNTILARSLGALASAVFDRTDVSAIDLAFGRQDHPMWEFVSWWFEAVPIDSDLARRARRNHRLSQNSQTTKWTERDAFVERLIERFQAVKAGDTNVFWALLWDLQVDVETGRFQRQLGDDLFAFPSSPLIIAGDRSEFLEAATLYLRSEHDHSDTWLGTDTYDRRAWAGYLALVAIVGGSDLDALEPEVWSKWCGAILWFHSVPEGTGDRALKRRFLNHAANVCSDAVTKALKAFVNGCLLQGIPTFELGSLDEAAVDRVGDCLLDLSEQIAERLRGRLRRSPTSRKAGDRKPETVRQPIIPATQEATENALTTLALLLGKLLAVGNVGASQLAIKVLTTKNRGIPDRKVAVVAAVQLLNAQPSEAWSIVYPFLSDSSFGRELAISLASLYPRNPIEANLSEQQLGDLYRWLAGLFPPEQDRNIAGAHFVGPDEEARNWRDNILRILAARCSERAVAILRALASEFPERLSITGYLVTARAAVHAYSWSPPTPDELAKLFSESARRLVRSNGELSSLLVETLAAIALDLPGHCELLWDRVSEQTSRAQTPGVGETWAPKPEAALCAYLAHELQLRLNRRGLAVNREILVRPTNAYGAGDRTDITVEAPPLNDQFESAGYRNGTRVAVVIEVKGNWNPGLLTDQIDQLATRYLAEAATDHGLYVVGWYPVELWTTEGRRRDDARRHVRSSVEAVFAQTRTGSAPYLTSPYKSALDRRPSSA